MENRFDIRSNKGAYGVRELYFADVQFGWDESSVVGEPEAVTSSTHGYGGNVVSVCVLEGDCASATFITVMGKGLNACIIHHVPVRGKDCASGAWGVEHHPRHCCVVVGDKFEGAYSNCKTAGVVVSIICCDGNWCREPAVVP